MSILCGINEKNLLVVNIQKKLDNLYLSHLDKILSDKGVVEAINNDTISSPLFIDTMAPQGNYIKRPFKVLYVGKENNGWFNSNEKKEVGLKKVSISNKDKYLEELKKLYFSFNIGVAYNWPIFNFLDILIDQIQKDKKDVESTGFLWTNLIRHSGEYGIGKIPENFEDKLMYDNNFIFCEEINILKPDAIIFVTGPNYDKFLEKTFPDICIEQIKNFDKREIAFLKHELLPKKSIRVYHPDYQNRLGGRKYMEELSRDIIECFTKVN